MLRSPEIEIIRDSYRLYDKILRGIAGENYENRFVDSLRSNRWITNGTTPQLLLPPDRHEGSEARYLFDFPSGEDQILLQVLRPGGKTSRHYHMSPVLEEYLPFSGNFYLNGVAVPPRGITILAGHIHQGEAKDGWSATFIKMKNVKGIPRHLWHIKV